MKKKNYLQLVAMIVTVMLFLVACAGERNPAESNPPVHVSDPDTAGLDDNLRFVEPRTISVTLWDRGDERMPVFAESYWAEWVATEIYEKHNIIIEWVTVPRWEEGVQMSTLLSASSAPDVGLTFDPAIPETFGEMGGLHDMQSLLQRYDSFLPHLYNLIGETMYWNIDPQTNNMWSITGRLFQDGRSLTFIREDWLDILGLPIPTNVEEFETTLKAFRDNAAQLPGNNNGEVIAYLLGADVSWHASTLFDSLVPSDITEREWFVRSLPGNTDQRLMHHEDVMREGTRILNRWFHEGLLWNDFIIASDADGADLIALGQVGAFTGNWDFPMRANPGFIMSIRENVGPDANFIPILPFVNDAGEVRTFFPPPIDRFMFFPSTNNEILASLLYLDFMSRPDVLDFLQFGIEGVHHEIVDGGYIRMLLETADAPWPNNQVVPSLRNFDIALTINGIHFFDENPEAAVRTLAFGYPGIDADAIITARNLGLDNAYWFRNVVTRRIESESGMTLPLITARDVFLHVMVGGTPIEDFDVVFDQLYEDYLNLGARAIMEEREQAWIETFGDVDTMP